MNRRVVLLVTIVVTLSLVIAICSRSASALTDAPKVVEPTKPAAPVAETTIPAASQPTSAPAKKVDFPMPGKAKQEGYYVAVTNIPSSITPYLDPSLHLYSDVRQRGILLAGVVGNPAAGYRGGQSQAGDGGVQHGQQDVDPG